MTNTEWITLIVTVWASIATIGFFIMWAMYRQAWWEGWTERITYDREHSGAPLIPFPNRDITEAERIEAEETRRRFFDPTLWSEKETPDVPDLIAYHTGGDTVADLRPLTEAEAADMNAAVQMPAPVDVPNDWPWNPDE